MASESMSGARGRGRQVQASGQRGVTTMVGIPNPRTAPNTQQLKTLDQPHLKDRQVIVAKSENAYIVFVIVPLYSTATLGDLPSAAINDLAGLGQKDSPR